MPSGMVADMGMWAGVGVRVNSNSISRQEAVEQFERCCEYALETNSTALAIFGAKSVWAGQFPQPQQCMHSHFSIKSHYLCIQLLLVDLGFLNLASSWSEDGEVCVFCKLPQYPCTSQINFE